jgi:hypothetical protein
MALKLPCNFYLNLLSEQKAPRKILETYNSYIINVKIIGKYSKDTNDGANLMISLHKKDKTPL